MKVVLNICNGYGGLSESGWNLWKELKQIDPWDYEDCWFYPCRFDRDDEDLVKIIETLGPEAYTSYSQPDIVEIPDEATDWQIIDCGVECAWYVLDGLMHKAETIDFLF